MAIRGCFEQELDDEVGSLLGSAQAVDLSDDIQPIVSPVDLAGDLEPTGEATPGFVRELLLVFFRRGEDIKFTNQIDPPLVVGFGVVVVADDVYRVALRESSLDLARAVDVDATFGHGGHGM